MKLFIANHIRNMKNQIVTCKGLFFFTAVSTCFVVLLMVSFPVILHASSHDTFAGDSVIYGTSITNIQPNVLLIIDSSGSMNGDTVLGDPYDPNTTYPIANACEGSNQPCTSNEVYRYVAFGVEGKWVGYINDVSSVSCTNASNSLTTDGQYQGRLKQDGTCNTWWPRSYALGNYVNWINQDSVTAQPKIDVAKNVVENLINTTSGVKIGAMIFNNNQGGDFINYNGYTATIKDMDAIFSGSTTNREALIDGVNNISADDWTPLAETLFEAMRYYSGGSSAFNSGTYTSPIDYACQKNYVVIVTDGMSTQDRANVLDTICTSGDCDGDGFEPANDPSKTYTSSGSDYLDDVAHYLYNNDMSSLSGIQNVVTYTVGFGLSGADQSAIDLLQETATNGGGTYYTASDYTGLNEALREIFSIILEDNTSFVAPVVPVSPENKTYSGSRVYLGFFRPTGDAFWYGNLKKYGIDTSGNVIDKDGAYATYVDSDGNGLDDRDGASLPLDISDGGFRELSKSYWSTIADGGEVDIGGAGDVLFNRSAARNIYTYTGTSPDLIDSTNAFTTSNTAITYSGLGVANDTEKDKLINFVHGKDAYDEDSDSDTTENRSWLLGDILHSKPLIVNYASYTVSPTNESNCSINKTIIYVGTNDGMLHAFRDCDGEEIWSFIPQDLLDELQYLNGSTHSYYVDSSPSVYIYDADKDGNIESGDKVILMFGERRGGGFYYALDVSDFNAPEYMWRINDTGLWKEATFYDKATYAYADYSELGQTWSEPTIGKIKDGTDDKMVVFIGAGYDNVNEDSRTGQTQTPVDAEGRGLYVVEVATLNSSGVPSFSNSGHKVWGYTYGATSSSTTNPNMQFSIASAVALINVDFNQYIDRLYVGDTGGNLWAFDIEDTNTANWVAREIFSSNPGAGDSSDNGRKIFYRPSVTLEVGYQMILFGTGDRAHPTEVDVVDRLYAVKDKGQTSVKTESSGLVDVTTDTLQGSSTTSSSIQTILSDLNSLYGWYIKLDQNAGEKVLAPAFALFRKAYYTTYTPNTSGASCDSGNRGTARIYVVNYKTGEAVYNYDTSNDNLTVTNTRALSDGDILQRSDRVLTLGAGIPSGVVVVITPSGITMYVGGGGALYQPDIPDDRNTLMLYWREVI